MNDEEWAEFYERAKDSPEVKAAEETTRAYLSQPEVNGEFERLDRLSRKKGTTLNIYSLMLQMDSAQYPGIADQLKALIASQRWSLTALGELAGVSPSVLSRFMSGETALTLDTADRLARSLRLTIQPSDSVLLNLAIVKDRRRKKSKE